MARISLETHMTRIQNTNIGDLISIFYARFMAIYGDEDLASVATASVINELLAADQRRELIRDAA